MPAPHGRNPYRTFDDTPGGTMEAAARTWREGATPSRPSGRTPAAAHFRAAGVTSLDLDAIAERAFNDGAAQASHEVRGELREMEAARPRIFDEGYDAGVEAGQGEMASMLHAALSRALFRLYDAAPGRKVSGRPVRAEKRAQALVEATGIIRAVNSIIAALPEDEVVEEERSTGLDRLAELAREQRE